MALGARRSWEDIADGAMRSTDNMLADIADLVLRRSDASGWASVRSGFWHRMEPPNWSPRTQGWKLHVSATPISSPIVLARAADILVRRNCAFKFAASLKEVGALVNRNCDRGGAGKFITAYPADDGEFEILAEELHHATVGLPGPRILSDRPRSAGSLVHYRYGAFAGVPFLTNDGAIEVGLRAPDGTIVPDERKAWFSPPVWAGPAPVLGIETGAAVQGDTPRRDSKVLLNERFIVARAIKHNNKGGVYLATDQLTGAEAIIKEARSYVGGGLTDTDSRGLLRNEAAKLDLLAPHGLTPRKLDLFEQGGNLFLAEELVRGKSLREWVGERLIDANRQQDAHALGLDVATASAMAGRLINLVDVVHGCGLVLRDLSPGNLVVTDDGDLRLIDLELVAEPGHLVTRGYTPGYGAREIVFAPEVGSAPEQTADLFSLGATLFFLITAIDPELMEDFPQSDARGMHQRLSLLIDTVGRSHPTVRRFAPLLSGLTADEPQDRWSLERARNHLRALPAEASAGSQSDRISPPQRDRMLHDGLAHLIASKAGDDASKLWPQGRAGENADPLTVQCGAAGVLAVMVRAAQADPGLCEGLDDVIRQTARWIDARLDAVPKVLPGLYFGRAGTAWALHDAALYLQEESLAERALGLASDLPPSWPNPDVCHGAAGAGLTTLRLWQVTGHLEMAERTLGYADALVKTVERRPEGVYWRIPRDFASGLAGLEHYGFAHGIAGIGAFLLLAGSLLERTEYVDLAMEAGDALLNAAIVDRGRAWWPSGENGSDERLANWCSGSSGVGTFLIRLGLITGEDRYVEHARQAAAAVRQERWTASPAACHGLAGNAEFLLDMADATGEMKFAEWAEELTAAIYAWNTIHSGLVIVPDESRREFSASYNIGLAGTVGMLVRLRYGGERLWLPSSPRSAAGQESSR